jgi:hypothetical protein
MKVKELLTYLARYDKDLEVVFSYDAGREGACVHGHVELDKPPVVQSDCRCGIVLEIGEAG